MSLKRLAEELAYRMGLYSLVHRVRNRNTLTIAMFHRVLPPSDPRSRHCNPEWTLTSRPFESCLHFFHSAQDFRQEKPIGLERLGRMDSLPPAVLAPAGPEGGRDAQSLIRTLAQLASATRHAIVAQLPGLEGPAAMMGRRQLGGLADAGSAVGSHGLSHDPLPIGPGQLLSRIAIRAWDIMQDGEKVEPALLADCLFFKPTIIAARIQ